MDDVISEAEDLNVTLAELLSQPNMSSVLSGAEFARCEEMFGYEFMPVEALDSVVSEVSLVWL